MSRRVVVTGMGVVCCLGSDQDTFWRRLLAGESGIGPITKLDPTGLRNEEAGEVQVFDWEALGPEGTPPVDEATQFAYAASAEALRQAGMECGVQGDASRVGLVFSTNFGGAASWESFAESRLRATGRLEVAAFNEFRFERAAEFVAEAFGLRGPKMTLSNSCSSGASAIGLAADLIRLGHADLVLAGGHDSLGLSTLAGLSILRTITAEKCRPFDKNRSGTIFGEGAGVLMLEAEDHAKERAAKVLARVLGYALNNNAYHLTAPDKGGQGMVEVLRAALVNACVTAEQIDYVNAHGTGTQYHDVAETQAIKQVLGPRAYQIPVSSIKAATGHVMAGAGSVEAIATILAMRDGVVPPTVNYETPDPECDLDYVPNVAKSATVRMALSISAGIGGNNAAVVLAAP